MVEPILHYIIPLALLLAFFPKFRKVILLFSPLALLPDLDFFLKLHRGIFHSIFFMLSFCFLLYFLAYFTARDSKKRKMAKVVFFIPLFYFSSHILLDITYPGIALFWPFCSNLFGIDFYILTNPQTFSISERLNAYTLPAYEGFKSQASPFLTIIGLVMLFLFLILAIVDYSLKRRHYGGKRDL